MSETVQVQDSTNNDLILYGVGLNFISVMLTALGPVINACALNTISPTVGALFSSIFGSFLCFLLSILKNKKIELQKFNIIFFIGLFNAIGLVFMFEAQSTMSPMVVGFLSRTYVIFATFIGVFFLKEKISRLEFIFILIAIISAFLLNFKGHGSGTPIGVIFVILQALFFAIVNSLIKSKLQKSDANSVLFFNHLISSTLILCYFFVTGQKFGTTDHILQGYLWLMLSSFLGSFVGLLLFYKGLRYISFAEAGLIRATAPIFTAFFSAIFFPVVSFSTLNVIGAILLVISIVSLSVIKVSRNKYPA